MKIDTPDFSSPFPGRPLAISRKASGNTLEATVSRRLVEQYAGQLPLVLIRRAMHDAHELAAGTGFPHLFFPALAEEKVSVLSRFLLESTATPSPSRSIRSVKTSLPPRLNRSSIRKEPTAA
jgi:hypothetical protein